MDYSLDQLRQDRSPSIRTLGDGQMSSYLTWWTRYESFTDKDSYLVHYR